MDYTKENQRGTLLRTFERIDRTLSEQPVSVERTSAGIAPSYTDGETIYFDFNMIGSLKTDEQILAINGLNFHELCHVLYTPRQHHVPSVIRGNASLMASFNILEDQRIETIFVRRFRSTKPYFVAAMMTHCVNLKDADRTQLFPLIYGRRFLGKNFVAQFETIFKYPDKTKRVKEIIDEYKGFDGNFAAGYAGAGKDNKWVVLIKEFAQLFTEEELDKLSEDVNPNGHSHSENASLTKGTPIQLSVSAQEATGGDSDGDGNESGTGGQKSDKKGSEGRSKDSKGEAGEDSEGDGTDGGAGDNKRNHASPAKVNKEITKAAKETIVAILADEEVVKSIKNTRHLLLNGDGSIYGTKSRKMSHAPRDASAQLNLVSTRIAQKFERLARENDPGFEMYKDNGRLNIGRVMMEREYDTVFDQWKEDKNDATQIEIVVGLDISGSTGNFINEISEAGWCIKKAVSGLGDGVSLTVHAYDTDTYELYGREEGIPTKVRHMRSGGGTDPEDFLKVATSIFTNTRRVHKILLMMTDGAWSNKAKCDSMIEKLNMARVTTGLLHVGSSSKNFDRHNTQIGQSSESVGSLIPFVEKLVTATARANASV